MAKIVRACREHLSEIALIESLCFSDPWSEKALELLLNESCVAFVALIDGRVAAYGGMMIVLDEGQVINIATHPDYRRQGLARDIMNALSHSACELGLGVMFLEVREQNLPVRALYRSDGWAEVGVRKNFYSHPVDNAVIMQKRFER